MWLTVSIQWAVHLFEQANAMYTSNDYSFWSIKLIADGAMMQLICMLLVICK